MGKYGRHRAHAITRHADGAITIVGEPRCELCRCHLILWINPKVMCCDFCQTPVPFTDVESDAVANAPRRRETMTNDNSAALAIDKARVVAKGVRADRFDLLVGPGPVWRCYAQTFVVGTLVEFGTCSVMACCAGCAERALAVWLLDEHPDADRVEVTASARMDDWQDFKGRPDVWMYAETAEEIVRLACARGVAPCDFVTELVEGVGR